MPFHCFVRLSILSPLLRNGIRKKKYLSSLVPLVPMIFGLPRNAAPWLMSSASAFANSSFTSMNTSSEASRCNVVKGVINRGKASRRAQSYYAIDPLMRSIVRIRSPREFHSIFHSTGDNYSSLLFYAISRLDQRQSNEKRRTADALFAHQMGERCQEAWNVKGTIRQNLLTVGNK